MKKAFSFMLTFALLFAFAACGSESSSSSEAQQDDSSTVSVADDSSTADDNNEEGGAADLGVDEIYFGAIAPLTGGVSQYGIAVNQGAMLAVEEINAAGGILGAQIKYVAEDDTGDPTEALSAYEKLYNDGANVIIGAVTSAPSTAMAQVAAEDGIPVISASATAAAFTEQGENIFRVCFIDPYQGQMMAHYAQDKLGAETVAVLYDNGDDYSSGIAAAFRDEAEALGMTVTNYEGYVSGADDFNTQLTRIKQGEPDVILVPSYYEDVAKVLTQASNLGIESTFLGADGWDGVHNQLDASNFGVLENTYFCSQYSAQSENPDVQAFIQNYRDTYDMEEIMFSVLAYDAVYVMADAITRAGSLEYADIIEALKTTSYAGLTGTTTFDAERNPIRTAYITVFEEGEPVVLEEYSFS